MWPIYFNIGSHLWIVYLFLFNGLLLHFSFRGISRSYRDLTQPFEAQLLAGFFLSIGLNGLILLMLDYWQVEFFNAVWILPMLSFIFLLGLWYASKLLPMKELLKADFSSFRIIFYACVFLVLFYNGGLIEQISDAWWHMSLANKIGLTSSFELSDGHVNGVAHRYYPPLWHGNLALARIFSGISIPTFWNSFTAWGAMLKVMAFYLFAYGLTKEKSTAIFASLLFVLLPGIGNSYLRVSAWPSHISYTAWFAMFYLCFFSLNRLAEEGHSFVKMVAQFYRSNAALVLSLVVLSSIVWFTHQAELLWFAVAMVAYFSGRSLNREISASPFKDYGDQVVKSIYRISLIILWAVAIWLYQKNASDFNHKSDLNLVFALPILFTSLLLLIEFAKILKLSKTIVKCLFFTILILIFVSIDYQHLISLYISELELPKGATHELPVTAVGYFGDQLALPSWSLQLRQGLLFSGILSIPIALIMVFMKPSRVTLFLASTASVAILFCISPYLHHWLRNSLGYHSSWRIAILIFHPITIAVSLQLLCQQLGWLAIGQRKDE